MESYHLEAPPPLPPSSPDIFDTTAGTESPLMQKMLPQMPSARLAWFSDAADLFALLCSVLLTATSIALIAIIFCIQTFGAQIPEKVLLYMQRVISTLSLTITSAVIMVTGKRYLLYKFTRGGLRSQRVAVYSNSTIGNLSMYLVLHGVELPLLGLLAVWGLALVTGLTVNDSWEMGSVSGWQSIQVLSGPLDPSTSNSSLVTPAIEELTFMMSLWCLSLMDTVGFVKITGANTGSSLPSSTVYYPPLAGLGHADYSFSIPSTINGFNISLEYLSSVPPTAENLSSCAQTDYFGGPTAELWYDGSDNQTLSIVVVDESNGAKSTFRINATVVIMGGTLSSNGTYTEFALNGTSWPNVMSAGNRWAQEIVSVICNTTLPSFVAGCSSPMSLSDFATLLAVDSEPASYNIEPGDLWSLVLSMTLGAYNLAMFSAKSLNSSERAFSSIPVTVHGVRFTSNYGTYILIVNVIVSIIMLIIVVRLRLASHLGSDFINSTRLLLEPLKKPELFNASLQTTVDACENPYLLVGEDNTFLVTEQKTKRKQRVRFRMFGLRKRSQSVEFGDDSTIDSEGI